jgi:hydroxybutyrate-dimer hydrolase
MRMPPWLVAALGALTACSNPLPERTTMAELFGPIRETQHRGADDLVSAGLGLDGLRGPPPAVTDPAAPTAAELRRRAFYFNWRGIADLRPEGGFGRDYGGVPHVPGREFQAFARRPGARHPHRVLAQIPDAFDRTRPCLVVTPVSGSRGIYGAGAVAGAWALPRGCAVVYTDKGAGSGWFDLASDEGVALDGTRARRGQAALEFEPEPDRSGQPRVAFKHAHSGDHPEADWGGHTLDAMAFGLAMLTRAYPELGPFTPENTGGAAVLRAAELEGGAAFAAVLAAAPNVHLDGTRPLYDYASEAALLMPCALAEPELASGPGVATVPVDAAAALSAWPGYTPNSGCGAR